MGIKLTKRAVDAITPSEKDAYHFDSDLHGFGLKCTPHGRKVYIVQYRIHGRKRRMVIGPHGSPWTPTTARLEASRLLGVVAEGNDPADIKRKEKTRPTIAELCELYLQEGVTIKKESTLATDRGRITRHILPLLGKKRAHLVKRVDVQRFMKAVADGKTAADIKTKARGRAIVKGGKGTANRTLELLGGIFAFAIDREIMTTNPVHGVKKFPRGKRERFLTAEELGRLGDALQKAEAEGVNLFAIAAIRLLVLSGCRRGEILNLEWTHVDFDIGCLRLPDSKTGAKIVQLGAAALEILAALPRIEDQPFVIPGSIHGKPLVGLPRIWRKIRDWADLTDVRIHDLRHAFASIVVQGGMGLPIVGALLGHSDTATTQRYAHLSADPLKLAADRISETIAAAMTGKTGEVVPFRKSG
ncbi:MAG: tyrosine-type recombinase/integrase [Magnetococcales bacterium]|nr:tyrosine-type recombinase/integrase [Magnetococcales bacterium]